MATSRPAKATAAIVTMAYSAVEAPASAPWMFDASRRRILWIIMVLPLFWSTQCAPMRRCSPAERGRSGENLRTSRLLRR
jgi:hypothetical protein